MEKDGVYTLVYTYVFETAAKPLALTPFLNLHSRTFPEYLKYVGSRALWALRGNAAFRRSSGGKRSTADANAAEEALRDEKMVACVTGLERDTG
jgi:hypothetical protein